MPVLDPGARGATNTFVQRGLGDVFIAWENEAYLQHLYSDDAQRLADKHYYRPSNPEIAKEFAGKFVDVELFGGWDKAQNDHFNDGGKFDSILETLSKR